MEYEPTTDELMNSALAIRALRAFDEHLRESTEIKRLATEVNDMLTFRARAEAEHEAFMEFRDRYMEQREADQAANNALVKLVVEAISRLVKVSETPPKIPPAKVILDQGSMTVNIPPGTLQPTVNLSPVVTVPESQVVIDRPNAPNRAIIKHSDGTRSEIIFEVTQ